MIVELFGPPGAGKTTFCHLLAGQLRAKGCRVDLQLSQRPAEAGLGGGAPPSSLPALLARFGRPLRELLGAIRLSDGRDDALRLSTALIGCLPQASRLRAFRVRQYLIRLALAWRGAARCEHVVIFDQGFVQAAFSLACTSPRVDAAALDRALDLLPRPELLISVDAPSVVLGARLNERLRGQTPIERSLETAARFTPDDRRTLDRLCQRLRLRGQRIVAVEAGEHDSAVAAARSIQQEITGWLAARAGTAPACPVAPWIDAVQPGRPSWSAP